MIEYDGYAVSSVHRAFVEMLMNVQYFKNFDTHKGYEFQFSFRGEVVYTSDIFNLSYGQEIHYEFETDKLLPTDLNTIELNLINVRSKKRFWSKKEKVIFIYAI